MAKSEVSARNQSNQQPKVYVDESGIHGKGLFAKEKIKKGELIGKVKSKAAKKDGPYVLWLDEGKRPRQVTCDLRFINHSKKPNAAYYDDLTVVALRAIKEGQEITHNYGDDWE